MHQIPSLLKLDRQEECCRDVNAFDLYALRVSTTLCDLTRPEVQSTRVRLSIEKVDIVLPHEEASHVYRISRPVCAVVINDRYGRCCRCTQRCARSVAQGDREAFTSNTFGVDVVNDRNRDSLRSFTGGKLQCS